MPGACMGIPTLRKLRGMVTMPESIDFRGTAKAALNLICASSGLKVPAENAETLLVALLEAACEQGRREGAKNLQLLNPEHDKLVDHAFPNGVVMSR